jgi:transcriptional regulator with XRE-family HTH domain
MEIGKAIKAARKAKGYTLQRLAEKSGVTITTLANWERGAALPNVLLLTAVADVLNMTLDELVGRDVAIKVRCNACRYFKIIYGVNWCNHHGRATQEDCYCASGRPIETA